MGVKCVTEIICDVFPHQGLSETRQIKEGSIFNSIYSRGRAPPEAAEESLVGGMGASAPIFKIYLINALPIQYRYNLYFFLQKMLLRASGAKLKGINTR